MSPPTIRIRSRHEKSQLWPNAATANTVPVRLRTQSMAMSSAMRMNMAAIRPTRRANRC